MAPCYESTLEHPWGRGVRLSQFTFARGRALRAWFWSRLPGVLIALTDYYFLGGGMCCMMQKRVKTWQVLTETGDWERSSPRRDPSPAPPVLEEVGEDSQDPPALGNLAARGPSLPGGSRSCAMEPSISAENGVPVRSATGAALRSLRALSGEWGPQCGVLRTSARFPEHFPTGTGLRLKGWRDGPRIPPPCPEQAAVMRAVLPLRPGRAGRPPAALPLALPSLLIPFPEPFFLRGPLQERSGVCSLVARGGLRDERTF